MSLASLIRLLTVLLGSTLLAACGEQDGDRLPEVGARIDQTSVSGVLKKFRERMSPRQ